MFFPLNWHHHFYYIAVPKSNTIFKILLYKIIFRTRRFLFSEKKYYFKISISMVMTPKWEKCSVLCHIISGTFDSQILTACKYKILQGTSGRKIFCKQSFILLWTFSVQFYYSINILTEDLFVDYLDLADCNYVIKWSCTTFIRYHVGTVFWSKSNFSLTNQDTFNNQLWFVDIVLIFL